MPDDDERPGAEVICAVIPGEDSAPAARMAGWLAERLDAALVLVEIRVAAPPVAGVPYTGAAPAMDPVLVGVPSASGPDAGQDVPVADLDALAEAAGVRPARTEAITATPVAGLVALSERREVELLVAPDRGGGPLRAKAFGNPGREGMRDVACPTVLVPADAVPSPLEPARLVCAVDDDEVAPTVVAFGAHLASRLGATLHAVRAVQTEAELAEARSGVEALCHDVVSAGVTVVADAVVADEATAALRDVADAHGAAMVVAGRPSHGALLAAVFGSAIHDLLDDGSVPVAVVPDAAQARQRSS